MEAPGYRSIFTPGRELGGDCNSAASERTPLRKIVAVTTNAQQAIAPIAIPAIAPAVSPLWGVGEGDGEGGAPVESADNAVADNALVDADELVEVLDYFV